VNEASTEIPRGTLVTVAEAARLVSFPERTLRRWIRQGFIRQYWWPAGSNLHGPRVVLEDVKLLRPPPIRSTTEDYGTFDFLLNRPVRGSVEVLDAESGVVIGPALVREGTVLELAAPHPDGLLVVAGKTVYKVAPSHKRPQGRLLFTATLATERDRPLALGDDDPRWQEVAWP